MELFVFGGLGEAQRPQALERSVETVGRLGVEPDALVVGIRVERTAGEASLLGARSHERKRVHLGSPRPTARDFVLPRARFFLGGVPERAHPPKLTNLSFEEGEEEEEEDDDDE